MRIATIETDRKTCVTTEGNLYLFFVDDANLNSGGANLEITEVNSCESTISDNGTPAGDDCMAE
jgi:hypothetical protein